MTKIFDYKISVNNKTVTFEILNQDKEVSKFFGSAEKTFGKMSIGNRAYLELSSGNTVYLKGSGSKTKDTKSLGSASAAFTYAADLTEALELMVAEITKKLEKKAAKTVKSGATNFEYSVSVDGSTVTLEIQKQTPEVSKFFRTNRSVGSHQIESCGCPEIRRIGEGKYRIFVKGSSSCSKYILITDSSSEALKVAATVTEIFDMAQTKWPEIFGTGPKIVKVLNVAKDLFVPGLVYIDSKDGELFIPSNSAGLGFSLSQDRSVEFRTSTSSWVRIGSLKETMTIFGAEFSKSKVLKKFRELNKTAVKQIWHK